jgi:hypothetical protein
MAYEPHPKNNYIFMYFEMSLKINNVNPLFIFTFIQMDISHKS